MGYQSIDNLYKQSAQRLLEFKNLYCLEKIHGTSAHVEWTGSEVRFFSGGANHSNFKALFDVEKLTELFNQKFLNQSKVVVHGEAYGGKLMGMSATYGKDLKFVVFDIKIDEMWLDVPNAHDLATSLGFEFVDYELVDSSLESLNFERDRPSTQAERNGIVEPMTREGVVIRPPFEVTTNKGRLIAKHKGQAFSETATPREIDPTGPKAEEMLKAESIAFEWATPMRLEHVIDALLSSREDKEVSMTDTPVLIKLMTEDIVKEAGTELPTLTAKQIKFIGTRTAKMLKTRLESALESLSHKD